MNNLLRYLKSRWPLVTLVLTTPFVVSGVTLWMTDIEPSSGVPGFNVVPVLQPSTTPLKGPPQFSSQSIVDRRQFIERLQTDLSELRKATSPDPLSVGRGLLQLGALESAEGKEKSAADAFRQVLSLYSDAEHWQVREARARLQVLNQLESRTPEARKSWKAAWQLPFDAMALHAKGQYLEAIDRANKALDVRRELWGAENVECAESLLQLARFSIEHSDAYSQAEAQVREVMEQIRTAVGPSHPMNGDGLYVLAILADDWGEFNKADRLYEDALGIYRGSVGEVSREFARTLNRQGRMHNVWWKDFGAGKTLRALQIREQILDRDHPDCAESMEDLGEVAYSLLNFARAENLLEEAISIRSRIQGADHPDLARPQSLLAVCQADQGNVSRAVVNVRRALTRSESCRGKLHPIVFEQQIILATIQKRGLADCSAGYLTSQKALDGLLELGQQGHPRYCRAIFEQGECLRTEAMYHLDEEVAHPSLAAAKNRLEDAVESYRALPQGEKIGFYCEALSGLCEILYYDNYLGNTRETARKLIEELEKVVTQNGGAMHPAYSLVSLGQGRYCSARGLYDQAIPFQKEFATRVQKQVGMSCPWFVVDSLMALAGVYMHQGIDLEMSRTYSRNGFDLCHELFRRNAASQCDSSRLPLLLDCFQMLSMNLSIAEQQDELPATYDMVLALRGLTTTFQASHRLGHDHSELQPLLREVRESRQLQKSIVFSTAAEESNEAWSNRLQVASERADVSDSELAIATQPFVSMHREITWRQLQAQLPPRAVFIDFMQYLNYAAPPDHQGRLLRHRRILAFILKDSGPPQCVALGSSVDIERAVTAWREAIDDFQRGEATDIDLPSRELARLVWDPIVARLGDVDAVTIAPDGPLCFVSFAALPGRRPGTYALEDYPINYVNSGRWMYEQLQNPRSSSDGGLLLCGDIEYQKSIPDETAILPKTTAIPASMKNREPLIPDPGEWTNLAATRLEIEQVGDLFQETHLGALQTTKLARGDATADALESAMAQHWRCIHFAGHGYFVDPVKAQALSGHFAETLGHGLYFIQRNQLLMSGLVLAPHPDPAAAPSILTAKDVGSLDLRGTDLVVLSACETGLGCTAGSDGVLGLTRAFLTAGTSSVISSLWKVEDAATSLLMEEFYRNLWERHQAKRDALRNAQITVLNAPMSISDRTQFLALRGILPGETRVLERARNYSGRSHPALWAAFVLNGDGG